MQSAYCCTNRIDTWWCQTEFFRGILSVLCFYTVRQDHLVHLTETSVETRNVTLTESVHLACICIYYYSDCIKYFPLCWTEVTAI